ncbi:MULTISPECIES: hypothetical protein [unclassified Undibacterium]|uniref:hypothetical protein n=1 Tax=unclassified Undibacterium TaxID=2630295 RepID=UPI002AC986B5|nr:MULTISPECIES: hypothetical protein [unclassified Undibacterium]MEB0138684.1 hypothetical protein [Undibacterium sp. CCC2.1]MEB0171485.1 hypothetical protein [Undibacterium sp. CCC1.1]MEB0175444.1 hypothetical protein [Undibacterium sp. CCC3.4]MEB0214685.1 hypothetical protein [Undibacterium sp. 5I2]WPX43353.1 hypothetical protein RHM61_18545 [Undibacterium sp. CCC3.4]
MAILGVAGLDSKEIRQRVNNGWRFLRFEETRSFIVFSQRRYSDIYFVPPNESHMRYAKKHILITVVLGWWGIPWGLIGTPTSIIRNINGGEDLTTEIIRTLN